MAVAVTVEAAADFVCLRGFIEWNDDFIELVVWSSTLAAPTALLGLQDAIAMFCWTAIVRPMLPPAPFE